MTASCCGVEPSTHPRRTALEHKTGAELEQGMKDWLSSENTAVIFENGKEVVAHALFRNTAAIAFWRGMGFSDYSLKLKIMP